MPELKDLMDELPADLLEAEDMSAGDTDTTTDEVDEIDLPAGTDVVTDDTTEEETTDEQDEEVETDTEEADDAADEEDNDDYFTEPEEEETPPVETPKPANPQPAVTDENTYILQHLNKIAVRVLLPTDDPAKPEIKTVEVYGYGDLPREYLGFASPYEAGVFNQAVVAQENRARELQNEYRTNKVQADMAEYTRKENTAIAEDLTELRREGLFPKFKGNPGTKEFNESEGAKEFDRVIAYMNQRNTAYQRAAQNGRAYRHIGFREAFEMLNGPNPKAAEKREQKDRRAAARRVVSSRGAKSSQRNISNKPVQNLNDLVGEFEDFVGGTSK